MTPLSIIGVFCEDIRVETGDTLTLVGLLPDNIHTAPLEASSDQAEEASAGQRRLLGKLCIYVRANFEPQDPVEKIDLRLTLPNDEVVEIGSASSDMIEKAKRDAEEKGNALAGIMTRCMLQPFQLPKAGILKLEAIIGSEVRIIGHLNFKLEEKAGLPNPSPR